MTALSEITGEAKRVSVELIDCIQLRFGVRLSLASVQLSDPLIDVARTIARELPACGGVCSSANKFFAVKREIESLPGIRFERIRPGSRLEDVLSSDDRRDGWDRFQRTFPNLRGLEPSERDAESVYCWGIFSGFIALLMMALLWDFASPLIAFPAAAVFLILCLLSLARWRQHLSTNFPRGYDTVGDIARRLEVISVPQSPDGRERTERRVLQELRMVMQEPGGRTLADDSDIATILSEW